MPNPNIFAGGGVNAFQGGNNPLYVQNMNSLKTAFTNLQQDIALAVPIGSVVMWTGDTTSIPAGYAVANGALLNTVTYNTLFGIIGTRYGPLVGADFRLPDLTTRIPRGTVGVPTVPTTTVTSVSSNVDVHDHTVNSSFSAGNAASHTHSGGVFTQGNANTHVHSGATVSGANSTIGFTAGNTATHQHVVFGNTGNASANHTHGANSGNANVNHTHTYFKANSGANNNTGPGGALHAHAISIDGDGFAHSHAMLFNSADANATGINSAINGANSTIGVNAQGAPTAVLGMSVSAPGAPNAAIGVNSTFAAGTATTINASTLSHNHNFGVTELVFIIRVS